MTNPAEALPGRNDKRSVAAALRRRPSRRKALRRIALWGVVLFCGWWAVGLLGAWATTHPRLRTIAPRQRIAGQHVVDVSVAAVDGVTTRGWLLEVDRTGTGKSGGMKRCVVLAAGIGGNRMNMVPRATFYAQDGWSVLLVDLRGTGESDAERISMGWNEALDLLAWNGFLRARGFQTVGVHGQSLGAAAAAYSSVRSRGAPGWDFVVLEACYANIRVALAARSRGLPGFLMWPLLVWSEVLLDVDADDLDPVAALRHQAAPTFLACGTRDFKVGPDATEQLFEASAAEIKVRCDVPGLGHGDLWGNDGLRSALLEFLGWWR